MCGAGTSVSIGTGWTSTIQLQVEASEYSLLHSLYITPGAHPASYPADTEGTSPGINWQGYDAYHSPPLSAKVKNGGTIYLLLHMSPWHVA
jgi:hypothetical protein